MSDLGISVPNEAEYSGLRAAILKYEDRQGQIESLSLIVAGALFSLSASTQPASTQPSPAHFYLAIFVYPIIAMFLAARWSLLAVSIQQHGSYIYTTYEKNGYGWEHHIRERDRATLLLSGVLGPFAIFGFFLGTQALAIVWSWLIYDHTQLETLLLIADGIAFLVTIGVLASANIYTNFYMIKLRRNE